MKKKPTGMTGGKPRIKKDTAKTVKKRLQAKLRERAIERDGSCVIGKYQHWLPFHYHECGPYRRDGELVLQAEHLVGRANSASYADMDNIILLCMRHHFYFKKQHGALYWDIVRRHIGEERWAKVQAWEREQRAHQTTHMVTGDWLRIEESL